LGSGFAMKNEIGIHRTATISFVSNTREGVTGVSCRYTVGREGEKQFRKNIAKKEKEKNENKQMSSRQVPKHETIVLKVPLVLEVSLSFNRPRLAKILLCNWVNKRKERKKKKKNIKFSRPHTTEKKKKEKEILIKRNNLLTHLFDKSIPVSSKVSRMAVCSSVSPSAFRPPGNATFFFFNQA
jgi:hypothetical protein